MNEWQSTTTMTECGVSLLEATTRGQSEVEVSGIDANQCLLKRVVAVGEAGVDVCLRGEYTRRGGVYAVSYATVEGLGD